MYKPAYYERKLAYATISQDAKVEKLQKGIRQTLLCPSCETLFSKWEKYAKEYLAVAMQIDFEPALGKRRALPPVDYRRFKLFLLSVLWRMAVSTHMMFLGVPEFDEVVVLRRMLLSREVGPWDEFGIGAVIPLFNLDRRGWRAEQRLIFHPAYLEEKIGRFVRLFAYGLVWLFWIPKAPSRRYVALFEDGRFVPRIVRYTEIDFIVDTFDEARRKELSRKIDLRFDINREAGQ